MTVEEALRNKIQEIHDYVREIREVEAKRLDFYMKKNPILDRIFREKRDTKLLKADIMERFAYKLYDYVDDDRRDNHYEPDFPEAGNIQCSLDLAIESCQNGCGNEKASEYRKSTFEETKKALTEGITSRVDSYIKEVLEIVDMDSSPQPGSP